MTRVATNILAGATDPLPTLTRYSRELGSFDIAADIQTPLKLQSYLKQLTYFVATYFALFDQTQLPQNFTHAHTQLYNYATSLNLSVTYDYVEINNLHCHLQTIHIYFNQNDTPLSEEAQDCFTPLQDIVTQAKNRLDSLQNTFHNQNPASGVSTSSPPSYQLHLFTPPSPPQKNSPPPAEKQNRGCFLGICPIL